jgi:transcriptional regulator with PAS, ATPase and Fis domain
VPLPPSSAGDDPGSRPDRIVGNSPATLRVFELIDRVAVSSATVMLTGESGTGKELVAREIHARSDRPEHAFLSISCTAIPAPLLEAELFGYERGAFTDAKIRKKGLMETADGGTVLLDEVGLMPTDLQAKFLRVLETQTFRRLGSTADIRVDVRFVAATNEDLGRAVSEGRFREDLFYRLNVFPIALPPLRARGDDALLIGDHFLELYAGRYGKDGLRFSDEARSWLMRHSWPGNVRELRNVVERSVLLSTGDVILAEDLAISQAEGHRLPEQRPPAVQVTELGEIRITMPPWGIAMEDVERKMIEAALARARGNVSRAAELLRLSRDTLRYRMKKHHLGGDAQGN